ncbi:hypothetical protein JCM3774_000474 [Rhodotorula dairenensis]
MAPNKPGSKGGPAAQRLKVVVRKLPPDLPARVFWTTTAQWITREDQDADGLPGAERVAWTQYRPGKVRKSGKDKDSVNSRAYIAFRTPEALVAFHKGYEGWAFRDKSGNLSQAVVEFAPYQRTPTAPAKPDPREGTIDDDPEYLAYQEALAAAPAPPQLPTETPYEAPKTTPLLDHLRQQKAASRTARKQALAAAKANGGPKGKGKMPAVLPGATKAQLATAAQGGVQAAAVGPSAKGAKGTKKDKDKKKDKAAGGAKSKEASRSATPVPDGSAPAGKGAAAAASPAVADGQGGGGTTGKGKGNSKKPAKKTKKERPAAPAAANGAATAAPRASEPAAGAGASPSQPKPNQTESPGTFRDGLSVAEAAVLDQHRHMMQQRIRLAGQQQPAALVAHAPGHGNGPNQLPRPGPIFVPAHLQAAPSPPSTHTTSTTTTTTKTTTTKTKPAQPQILRKPNAGGMLAVAGAGAQQQAASANSQEQQPTASSSSNKRSRGAH